MLENFNKQQIIDDENKNVKDTNNFIYNVIKKKNDFVYNGAYVVKNGDLIITDKTPTFSEIPVIEKGKEVIVHCTNFPPQDSVVLSDYDEGKIGNHHISYNGKSMDVFSTIHKHEVHFSTNSMFKSGVSNNLNKNTYMIVDLKEPHKSEIESDNRNDGWTKGSNLKLSPYAVILVNYADKDNVPDKIKNSDRTIFYYGNPEKCLNNFLQTNGYEVYKNNEKDLSYPLSARCLVENVQTARDYIANFINNTPNQTYNGSAPIIKKDDIGIFFDILDSDKLCQRTASSPRLTNKLKSEGRIPDNVNSKRFERFIQNLAILGVKRTKDGNFTFEADDLVGLNNFNSIMKYEKENEYGYKESDEFVKLTDFINSKDYSSIYKLYFTYVDKKENNIFDIENKINNNDEVSYEDQYKYLYFIKYNKSIPENNKVVELLHQFDGISFEQIRHLGPYERRLTVNTANFFLSLLNDDSVQFEVKDPVLLGSVNGYNYPSYDLNKLVLTAKTSDEVYNNYCKKYGIDLNKNKWIYTYEDYLKKLDGSLKSTYELKKEMNDKMADNPDYHLSLIDDITNCDFSYCKLSCDVVDTAIRFSVNLKKLLKQKDMKHNHPTASGKQNDANSDKKSTGYDQEAVEFDKENIGSNQKAVEFDKENIISNQKAVEFDKEGFPKGYLDNIAKNLNNRNDSDGR